MPLYDFECSSCGRRVERLISAGNSAPVCKDCGQVLTRLWSGGSLRINIGPPAWVDRMEDIGKRQNDRGERRRFVHPSEVL